MSKSLVVAAGPKRELSNITTTAFSREACGYQIDAIVSIVVRGVDWRYLCPILGPISRPKLLSIILESIYLLVLV